MEKVTIHIHPTSRGLSAGSMSLATSMDPADKPRDVRVFGGAKQLLKKILLSILLVISSTVSHALPKGFVYLSDISPDIIQDIRYATDNNFIGNPIPGYQRGVCILTKETAEQLKKIQQAIKPEGYSLKVYDCYRPQKAVNYFYKWSQDNKDQRHKKEYYPRENKKELFAKEYIAKYSGHTHGSTVDLTLVPLKKFSGKRNKHYLTRCFSKSPDYLNDNSLDMGTRFDCFDLSAHIDYSRLSKNQQTNRLLLLKLMTRHGFKPYKSEWWHFTLVNEPRPNTFFDFPVR